MIPKEFNGSMPLKLGKLSSLECLLLISLSDQKPSGSTLSVKHCCLDSFFQTTNNFIIKDTFDFVNKVSKLPNTPNQRMVSFDVESLFTNIPTQETINIILDRAYKDNATEYYGLKKETLEKLLIICTQQSHFQFNGKYYDQIDGVAMGSPLGPLFANIFMDEFEQSKMKKLIEFF